MLAGCAVPLPLSLSAPATPAASDRGASAPVVIAGSAPTPTVVPAPAAAMATPGPIPTALPVQATPLGPGLPDLPLSPSPTLIPAAAAAATAAMATAAASATGAAATATALPAQVIRIQNFAFDPPTLTVPAGTTVFWQNFDAVTHQIDGPGFDSGWLYPSRYWATRLERPGTYDYSCSFHPTMHGQIVVTPPSVAERVAS